MSVKKYFIKNYSDVKSIVKSVNEMNTGFLNLLF
jgi:hypothetical protein